MIPPRGEGHARVVTWNVWWRFGDEPDRRADAIAATLSEVDADVVCLQEVFGDGSGDDGVRLAAGLGLHHHAGTPPTVRGASFGNAVLSRWPVLDGGDRALSGADGRPGHRRVVWARLDAPAGPLVVMTTHLTHRFDESDLRCRQIAEVLSLAAELRGPGDPATSLPMVLAGDLNATPDSDEVRRLTGRSAAPVPGLVFTDCWPQVRDDPGHTWTRAVPYTVDATWPERRLDYITVSWPRRAPLGNPVAAHLIGDRPVEGVWASDHLGVVVDLEMTAR